MAGLAIRGCFWAVLLYFYVQFAVAQKADPSEGGMFSNYLEQYCLLVTISRYKTLSWYSNWLKLYHIFMSIVQLVY